MKKLLRTFVFVGRLCVLMIIVGVAWSVNGVQSLFHGSGQSEDATDGGLFKLNEVHADTPSGGGGGGGY